VGQYGSLQFYTIAKHLHSLTPPLNVIPVYLISDVHVYTIFSFPLCAQPVQSLADRYARKLKSRDKVTRETKSSEEEPEASFGEQAGILQVLHLSLFSPPVLIACSL